jgi:putative permease
MLDLLGNWYRNKFSDPDALMLLLLIIFISTIILLWGSYIMPVLVAIVLAYLLDSLVGKLESMNLSRTLATSIVMIIFIGISSLGTLSLLPTITKQSVNLLEELPLIWQGAQAWILTLPVQYPGLFQAEQITSMMSKVNESLVSVTQNIISVSFSSLVSVGALLIYLILVPLMMFFMLKDKPLFMANVSYLLPKERRLIYQVASEMNTQIGNYIRGKVIEIIIVGAASCLAFVLMDLRYAILLGVLVGLSVLIPYIGAAVVTIPVAFVALFQWGFSAEFGYLMLVYFIIQALDGNLIVPILFSEAVALHPLYIIVAVLFFGGIWGFWGVFFAIPLATLVKALISAWSNDIEDNVPQT